MNETTAQDGSDSHPHYLGYVVDAPSIQIGAYDDRKLVFTLAEYQPGETVRILQRNPIFPGSVVVSVSSVGLVTYHPEVTDGEATDWIVAPDMGAEIWFGNEVFQTVQHMSLPPRFSILMAHPFLIRANPNPWAPLKDALTLGMPFIAAIEEQGPDMSTATIRLSSRREVSVTRKTQGPGGPFLHYEYERGSHPTSVPSMFVELHTLDLLDKGEITSSREVRNIVGHSRTTLGELGHDFHRWPLDNLGARARVLRCAADPKMVEELIAAADIPSANETASLRYTPSSKLATLKNDPLPEDRMRIDHRHQEAEEIEERLSRIPKSMRNSESFGLGEISQILSQISSDIYYEVEGFPLLMQIIQEVRSDLADRKASSDISEKAEAFIVETLKRDISTLEKRREIVVYMGEQVYPHL